MPRTLKIPLSQNKVALIDAADLPLVEHRKWHARRKRGAFYAEWRGGGKTERMHRVIMGDPQGFEVDHINGDGLDNRRSNLRICTRLQNSRNRRSHRGSASRFVGVSVASSGKWRAAINVRGKQIHLGTFIQEVDAALAYDKAARRLFGEFANPNFPEASS